MKICTKCKVEKNDDSYYKRKGTKSLSSWCKSCYTSYYKENNQYYINYRLKNKEKIKQSNKKYALANVEKIKEYRGEKYKNNKEYFSKKNKQYLEKNKQIVKTQKKEYNTRNKENIKEYQSIYRLNNKDKAAAYKKEYYLANKDMILAKQKDERKNIEFKRKRQENHKRKIETDIQYRLRDRIRTRLCGAVNNKSGSAIRDLGCSVAELKVWLENQFQIGMSWDTWGVRGWHIDHKIPLAHFDLTDRNQFLLACHYTNLQPLWHKDNCSKAARYSTQDAESKN